MHGFALGRPSRVGATPTVNNRPAETTPGRRLYAIGDVHGRLDLLRRLCEGIDQERRAAPGLEHRLVLLGDYIDRGPESRAVLDWLIARSVEVPGTVALAGNHEDSMLRFLDDLAVGPSWLYCGGRETLMSYGIEAPRYSEDAGLLRRLQDALRAALPAPHVAFLRGLPTSHVDGDYFFVHAGVRPRVPLAEQRRADLLWIREEFLGSGEEHGKVVVHGHTISRTPELRRNRIGIDTGAFASDTLTCVVLEGAERRFIQT